MYLGRFATSTELNDNEVEGGKGKNGVHNGLKGGLVAARVVILCSFGIVGVGRVVVIVIIITMIVVLIMVVIVVVGGDLRLICTARRTIG
jgi:hypothetical protein